MKNFTGCYLKKAKLIFLILLFFSITSTSFAQSELLPQLIKKIKPSVVAVVIFDSKNQQIAQGSGFFIAMNRVVTNRHVIEDADHALVKTHDGKSLIVQGVLAASEEDDLALLQINVPAGYPINPLTLTKKAPEEGERVLVIGNPLGLEGTISDGLISSIRELSKSKSILQITAPISPGSSGSPVINLAGQVVGVATSQLTKGQNLNFAMPSARITDLRPSPPKTLAAFTSETEATKLSQANRLVLQGKAIIWAAVEKTMTNKQPDGSYTIDMKARKKAQGEAFPLFKQATELAPNFDVAWYQLGDIYKSFEKYQEAVAAYKTALSLNPNNYYYHWDLADAYRDLKEYKLAIESYQKFIDLTPPTNGKVVAALQMGNIYYSQLNDIPAAIKAYRQGLGIMKVKDQFDDELREHLAFAYQFLGIKLTDEKKYDEALNAFKQIFPLSTTKYDAGTYNGIGKVYVELEQYKEALEAFQQAINLNPNLTSAYVNIAEVHLRNSNNSAAIEACKKAISLEPDNGMAHFTLGLAYLFEGNKSAALEEYKILKPLNPKTADILFSEIYK